MEYKDILYNKKDGVATLTINRPDKLNCFRSRTVEELTEALKDASGDWTIGVIVITGDGEKAFCVGGDIQEMKDLTQRTGRIFINKFLNFLLSIKKAPKPVICAVKGYCLGGGNEINVSCDLTIATEDALFGQVGPVVGSIPVVAGTQLLPRIVGEKKAREIVFLCQRYSANEALQMGLINKVMPKDKFDAELKTWCDRILELSPQALRIAKTSFNFEGDALYPSFNHAVELICSVYNTEEIKEGMTAFIEKRKPDFARFRR
ncbi:MAG TPA: enoyl-CoA hydratase-related protein [bacterium]